MWTENQIPQWDSGMLFVGSKGLLLSDYFRHKLLPGAQYEGFEPPPQTIAKSLGQIRGVDSRPARWANRRLCNFEYSGWLTEANHLGNVAYRLGKKLEWDAAAMRCTNAPEAERLLASGSIGPDGSLPDSEAVHEGKKGGRGSVYLGGLLFSALICLSSAMNVEQQRLDESAARHANRTRWGPYLSERQWGTVREDYSPDGECWTYFPHDHERLAGVPLG